MAATVMEKREAIAGLEELVTEILMERVAMINIIKDHDERARVERENLVNLLNDSLESNATMLNKTYDKLQEWRRK